LESREPVHLEAYFCDPPSGSRSRHPNDSKDAWGCERGYNASLYVCQHEASAKGFGQMPPEEFMKSNPRPIARSVVLLPFEKHKAQPLSPFFLTNQVRRNIERVLPPGYHRRMSLYFECYGCIGCKRKDVLYVCNGLCRPCLKRITKRLQKIDSDSNWALASGDATWRWFDGVQRSD
jgi:hypothetical protein